MLEKQRIFFTCKKKRKMITHYFNRLLYTCYCGVKDNIKIGTLPVYIYFAGIIFSKNTHSNY